MVNCAVKMAKSINENKIVSEFEKKSFLRRNVTRCIFDINSAIRKIMGTIALDESTDVSNVSRLLLFVRYFSTI